MYRGAFASVAKLSSLFCGRQLIKTNLVGVYVWSPQVNAGT